MIEVKNLQKAYGNKTALRDVSFNISSGEVVGLLGLNGAGKSTTMNILTGCLAPGQGEVLIDGTDMTKQPLLAKKSIGYLPEIPPLYVDMQVMDYLDFVAQLKGVAAPRSAHIEEICSRVGLVEVKKRLIRNLSKGYRQRVGLGAALLGNPKILILDEPTVGLDPTQIIEIRSLIAEMGKSHTVILSSHILSEISAVCSRVIVLDKGEIVADDTPTALEATLQNKGSCIAAIEGPPSAVLETISAVVEIASVKQLSQTEDGVWEYEITGHPDTDIRRPLFFALAGAGFALLQTKGRGGTLEGAFLQIVTGDKHTKNTEGDTE